MSVSGIQLYQIGHTACSCTSKGMGGGGGGRLSAEARGLLLSRPRSKARGYRARGHRPLGSYVAAGVLRQPIRSCPP